MRKSLGTQDVPEQLIETSTPRKPVLSPLGRLLGGSVDAPHECRTRWAVCPPGTVSLAACSQWHLESVSPRELVSGTHPRQVRVTRQDSTVLVVDGPAIVGDSLHGRVQGKPSAIALPEITGVAVRQTHGAHTALLMGGMAALTAGVIAVASDDGGPSPLRTEPAEITQLGA